MPLLSDAVQAYDPQKTRTVLGISKTTLRRLHQADVLPCIRVNNSTYYPSGYIDGLSKKIKAAGSHGLKIGDLRIVCRLYRLQHAYDHPTGNTPGQIHRYRAKLKEQCDGLVAEGLVVPLDQLVYALRHHYARSTIMRWAWTGRIVSFRIGRAYYMSVGHYRYLIWLITKCDTVSAVAGRLGVDPDTLHLWIQKGQLPTVKAPDDILRIDRRLVNNFTSAPPLNAISVCEAASILGCEDYEIRRQLAQGNLAGIREAGTWWVPDDEVAKWKRKFSTLNEGFEWLDGQATSSSRLLTSRQVCRLLNIHPTTLKEWCAEEVLPYYMRSFCTRGQSHYFVYLYVYGLGRFASGKVTLAVARRYKQTCAEARIVL